VSQLVYSTIYKVKRLAFAGAFLALVQPGPCVAGAFLALFQPGPCVTAVVFALVSQAVLLLELSLLWFNQALALPGVRLYGEASRLFEQPGTQFVLSS
jgi:hypothetical protein